MLTPMLVAAVVAMTPSEPGSFVELGVRTETRSRVSRATALGTETALDVEVVPSVRLDVRGRTLAFSASYDPRLLATDLEEDGRVQVLHRAELAGTAYVTPVWRLRAAARGERGARELVQLVAPAAGGIDPVRTFSLLETEGGELALAAYGEPSPRWRLEASATGRIDGGADASSRALLPLQRTAIGTGALSWFATPRDALGVAGAASVAALEGGGRARIASGLATWRHALDRTWDLRLGAGAAWSETDRAGQPGDSTRSAVGEAALAGLGDEGRLRGQLAIRFAPAVHRLTGDVDQRTEASLDLEGAITPRLGVGGNAWGAFIPRAGEDRALLGGAAVRATWRVDRTLTLTGGLFGQLQRDPLVAPGVQRQLGSFVALAYRTTERAPW